MTMINGSNPIRPATSVPHSSTELPAVAAQAAPSEPAAAKAEQPSHLNQVEEPEQGSASPIKNFFKNLLGDDAPETPEQAFGEMLKDSSIPDPMIGRLLKGERVSADEVQRMYQRTSIGRNTGSKSQRKNDAHLMDLCWQVLHSPKFKAQTSYSLKELSKSFEIIKQE